MSFVSTMGEMQLLEFEVKHCTAQVVLLGNYECCRCLNLVLNERWKHVCFSDHELISDRNVIAFSCLSCVPEIKGQLI